jgi:hypothetical protein
MIATSTLTLVRESKIGELMPSGQKSKRWEASGVLAQEGHYFVVFDDRGEVARLADTLQPDEANKLLGFAHAAEGYEGIAYNANNQRFYLLVEAREQSSGVYQAMIAEYDDDFQYVKERPLDFDFESSNKGFEAAAYVRRNERDYVLALCEGNKCKCGAKGRKPGGGRVQLFEKRRKRWDHADTIALPAAVPFVDYSGMSLDCGRVAIVSQENSMLWVGQFDETSWTWRDDGQLYEFPRTEEGAIRYGNIEGVSWISRSRVVTVSDRRKKKSQPDDNLAEKDQSVHLFDLPGAEANARETVEAGHHDR